MARHYKNAEAVLPKGVLDAVSEALGGRSAFLWVAAKGNLQRDQRNERVLELRAQGWQIRMIADSLFLSERTVFRILERERAAREQRAEESRRAASAAAALEATGAAEKLKELEKEAEAARLAKRQAEEERAAVLSRSKKVKLSFGGALKKR